MKLFSSIAIVFLLLNMAGCERAAEESNVATEVAVAVDCPVAGDAGNLKIAPGLTATILKKGYGRAAISGDYADVHTTLWLHDENADGGRGTEVWSSGGTQPFQFQLGAGQVIEGWDMGVPCMLVGETRELIVAGDLAYGKAGRPPIPPNATLLFNIELVKLTAPDQ